MHSIQITSLMLMLSWVNNTSHAKNHKWSEHQKNAFIKEHQIDTSTQAGKIFCNCTFEHIQQQGIAYSSVKHNEKKISRIIDMCQTKADVVLNGHLTQEQNEIIRNEMLRLVNNFRKDTGNTTLLITDADLDAAAQIQSDYNAWHTDIYHIEADEENYKTPSRRLSMIKNKHPHQRYFIGENIASMYIDTSLLHQKEYLLKIANELFETWRTSETHRLNMLLSSYKHFGFAVTIRRDTGEIHATQDFQN